MHEKDALLMRAAKSIKLRDAKIRALTDEVDNLRLTLEERNTYISDVESASFKKDTEIELLRLEIESLTLWREKINQQMRTEADIQAARSAVLKGKNATEAIKHVRNTQNGD